MGSMTERPDAEASDRERPSPRPATRPAPLRARWRLWARRLAIALVVLGPIAVLALWIAIHRVVWLGPWLADLGRSLLGNDAIAKLEDWAYGLQDDFNRATRNDEKPIAHWEVPQAAASAPTAAPKGSVYPAFRPKDVGPMNETFSAPGDGVWVPMVDPRATDEPAPLFKTLLHPDPKRAWSLVAVVAVDLHQVRLHPVAGTHEPMSKLSEAKAFARTGLIATSDVPRALAAFNGGFKTTHGNYGMKAHGVLFVAARPNACTIAGFSDDELRIGGWEGLSPREAEMQWFRQTPACMFDDGVMHKGLSIEENTLWGATLDKNTVIRRSAIGLDPDGGTLFVGISDATTATAIARAMRHAGAHSVAQLDVNWSYPRFVTVEPQNGDAANPKVKAIIGGFEYTEDDYVRTPATRDFFYLTRKASSEVRRPAPSGSPSGAPTEAPAPPSGP